MNPLTISVDKDQLRTNKSMFWGGAFGSSIWDPSSLSARNSTDLKLAVPMLHLASGLSTDLIDGLTDRPSLQDEHKARQEERSMPASQDNQNLEEEAFTIKSGRKQKAKTMENDSKSLDDSSKEYDITLDDEEEGKAREKAARKAERKAQKRLEKAARKLAREDGMKAIEADCQEEEAFDYGNAESVLHGKRKDVAEGSKVEKPFDPYAKSSNAPKSMRKLQTERAGKSYTFKS
jgi:exosome complex exonuclease RRP6